MFFYRRSIGQLYNSDTDSDTVRTQNNLFRQATKMATKKPRSWPHVSYTQFSVAR